MEEQEEEGPVKSNLYQNDPWKCTHCSAEFAQFRLWILHQESHHPATGGTATVSLKKSSPNDQPPPHSVIDGSSSKLIEIEKENSDSQLNNDDPPPLNEVSPLPVKTKVIKKSRKRRTPQITMKKKKKIKSVNPSQSSSPSLIKNNNIKKIKSASLSSDTKNNNNVNTNKMNVTKTNETFKCALCPLRSASLSLLKIHFQKNHPPVRKYKYFANGNSKGQDKGKKQNKLKTKVKSHYKDYVTCKILPKNEGRMYTCNYPSCNYQSPINSIIHRHAFTHTGEQPFSCHICSRAFSQKQNLNRHLNSVHVDQNPFACSFSNCKRSFSNDTSLKAHMKVHGKSQMGRQQQNHNQVKSKSQQQKVKNKMGGKGQRGSSNILKKSRISSNIYKSSPHISCSVIYDKIMYICNFCQKPFSKPSACVIHSRLHL